MIAGAPAAEAAVDSLANTQSFAGLAALSEPGQIALAGLIGGTGLQLAGMGAALNGLAATGLFGPTVGVTPQHAATNITYAYLVNSLLG